MKTQILICSVIASLTGISSALAAETQTMGVGTGSAKFNGLLQAWTVNDTTAAATGAKLNYRLRRAEVKFSGSVADSSRWFVMLDPAKSLRTGAIASTNDNKVLQDLGVAFSVTPELEFIAGQFKTPTTAEGLDWSGDLLFPERALVNRTYGDRREPGLMAVYKTAEWKLSVMGSNGQGANVDDATNDKDLSARLDITPDPRFQFGAFTTAGDLNYGTKARWGLNAKLMLDELLLRAEGVKASDSTVASSGFVFDGGYKVTERFQPIARFDAFNSPATNGRAYCFGLNYHFARNGQRIQAAYSILNNLLGTGGTTALARDTRGTLFTLAFQAAI